MNIDKLANTLNSIWAYFELEGVFGPYGTREAAEGKGKVFEGAGWVTTVMKLGKPEDIDQD